MTKRIFRSIMLVSAVCMVTGLAFLMGVLYHFFGNLSCHFGKKESLPMIFYSFCIICAAVGHPQSIITADNRRKKR